MRVREVFGKCGQTLAWVFDITFQTKLKLRENKIFYKIYVNWDQMSKHRHSHNFLLMNLRTSKKEQPSTSGSSPPFSSAEGMVTPSTPAGKTLFRPAPPLDFFWADILAFCKPKYKLSIKHLKTIIKFSDWPGIHVMYDGSAWFLKIIRSSLHAFFCLLSVKKQTHDCVISWLWLFWISQQHQPIIVYNTVDTIGPLCFIFFARWKVWSLDNSPDSLL